MVNVSRILCIPHKKHYDLIEITYKKSKAFIKILAYNSPEEKGVEIFIVANSLAMRITDEGNYIDWGNDWPNMDDSDWKVFSESVICELEDTNFLKWYRKIKMDIDTDKVHHFVISTLNEIIDVIAVEDPEIILRYREN